MDFNNIFVSNGPKYVGKNWFGRPAGNGSDSTKIRKLNFQLSILKHKYQLKIEH